LQFKRLAVAGMAYHAGFATDGECCAMRIWIDADACPKPAKDQVVKFALKRGFEVLLVAGQAQIKPAYSCVRLIVVPSGPDAADDYLVEHAFPGELVICSDVPLADRLVKKGVAALDPRGREFDERNMGDKLAVRNLFTELRELGQVGGGQPPYGERDKQAFANSLDRILTRLQRQA
jgi:uncharacterized protein YaiI (UPF0178 family)